MINVLSLGKLMDLQKELDNEIVENKKLYGLDLVDDKVIALEVELSELANEIRFFKFWSNKEADKRKALFEYVDVIHFFLSIAIDLDVKPEDLNSINFDIDFDIDDEIDLYATTKRWILNILVDRNPEFSLMIAYRHFIELGKIWGFTDKDVIWAYKEKNKENHKRQKTGY